MTPASGGCRIGKSSVIMCRFAEIINDVMLHRNILEVILVKTEVTLENGDKVKAKTLTAVDLSEFLFDVINLTMEDCDGISFHTYLYDTKEVKLKKGVDFAPYLTSTRVLFKGHDIIVCISSSITSTLQGSINK